ncbi:MAG: ABC transporter permease [Pseudomonadota bacterium]
MLKYYFRLAWSSIRRNPLLTMLMIGAIALGIGVSMTTLTLYYVMSSNPLPFKSEQVYAVQLDAWDPEEPYYDDDSPPPQLTYGDAAAMMRSDIPTYQATMISRGFSVKTDQPEARPQRVSGRATYGDFFAMFDVPFAYGTGWDRAADDAAERVVVLSKDANEKFFGGTNSVGEVIYMDEQPFRVVGVLASWRPVTRFYDLNTGAFNDPEDVYVPFLVPISLEYGAFGNTNCWKPENIESYEQFLQSECIWVQHWAQLDSAAQKAEFLAFMDGYAAEQNALGRFARPRNNRLSTVTEWLDAREVVSADNTLLVVLSFMFLLICLLNTVGLMLAKFINRAPLVGVRRALGASRLDVISQHAVEVLIVGIGGGLVGLCFAYLGLLAVRSWYEGYEYLAKLDVTMMLVAIALAISAALLAGLYPTWRISRIQPAVHLKTQ